MHHWNGIKEMNMNFHDFNKKMGFTDSSGFAKRVYELLSKDELKTFQSLLEEFNEAGLDIYGTASGDQYFGIGRKPVGKRTRKSMVTLHIDRRLIGKQLVFEFDAENHKDKSWGKPLIEAYKLPEKNGFHEEMGIPYYSPRKNVNYFVFPLLDKRFIYEIKPQLIEDFLKIMPKTGKGNWPVDYKSSEQKLEVAMPLQEMPQMPEGNLKPKTVDRTISDYDRDPKVKAWVLQQADGKCECCSATVPALFIMAESKQPYLEVHHVVPLANDGPDTPANTVAICPSCHRELHFGENKDALCDSLYQKVQRLKKPGI
jgi:5-methylcytosine-specific restriction protein A